METISIQARDLKKGMVCAFTGETVQIAPSRGLYTPKGKVDLQLVTKHGELKTKTWNAKTLISIIPQP